MIERTINGLSGYIFEHFENTGLVRQVFTTKHGGVSTGYLKSLNLGTLRGDDPANVYENYKRVGNYLGVTPSDMILSAQTHTTNVVRVGKEQAGNGLLYENAFSDVDGLITNETGIVLVTSYADCVPLYFLDPVNKAIGLSHSGWRGTVHRMGLSTIQAMQREFGSKPENILAGIGPCICQKCYEVSEDVALEFENEFGATDDFLISKGEGKYLLDLRKANVRIMNEAGIPEENIENSDICTCCNSDIFFSHRATNGKRGNVCAFLGLK